jgi:hypothetical protein
MKKAIVIILMILPFLLIYFISFTGQVLSKYTHINVERIAVVNDVGDEYKENDYIKIGLNDEFTLRVKVYPELASNKKVSITNSNKTVCTIDESSMKVTGLDYGEATFVITSVDRHFVQYVINIKVAEDKMTDFVLSKTEVELAIGKSEKIETTIIPSSVLPEYKKLIWISDDQSIAKVDQNGLITGVSPGITYITVRAQTYDIGDKEIEDKKIKVTVTNNVGKGVWFNIPDPDSLYVVPSATFDLKSIVLIKDVSDCQISDVHFEIVTDNSDEQIDRTRLDEGIITFKQSVIVGISLSASVPSGNYTDQIYMIYYFS